MKTEEIFDQKITIILDGMKIPISIGAHEFEKKEKQSVEIDVHIEMNTNYSVIDDELKNSFDYDRVYNILKKHTNNIQHVHLQETLVSLIAEDIKKLDGRINKISIYTKKIDIYKDCKSIGVKLELNRKK